MVQVLAYRAWTLTGRMHGGVLRSLQLVELCNRRGLELVEIKVRKRQLSWLGLRIAFEVFVTLGFRIHSIRPAARATLIASSLAQQLASWQGKKVLFYEATRCPVAPLVARQFGFRVIAFPHNVESFNDIDEATQHTSRILAAIRGEIRTLMLCDMVFTISFEDFWFFKQFLQPVYFLPYWPPEEVRRRAERVGQARQRGVPRRVLMIGTPQPVHRLSSIAAAEYLHVLGLPATIFASAANAAHVALPDLIRYVEPPVNDEAFEQLLVEAQCLVVCQSRGSGALTRIPEALLAGIPVICTAISARTYWSLPGVTAVNAMKDITPALISALPHPPQYPFTPPDLEVFIEASGKTLQTTLSHN